MNQRVIRLAVQRATEALLEIVKPVLTLSEHRKFARAALSIPRQLIDAVRRQLDRKGNMKSALICEGKPVR